MITLIDSDTVASSFGGSVNINTIGATLVVISVSSYSGGPAPTISDGGLNTFIPLTARTTGSSRHQIYYSLLTVTSPGHIFNVTGSPSYIAAHVYVFSGVDSYHSESGATGTSLSSLASGSVTPSTNGSLIITGVSGDTAVTDSVTAGFTSHTTPYTGGSNMQGSAAYYVQPTSGAINPTWSFSPNQTGIAVSSAVFLPTVTPTTSNERTSLSVSLG